MAGNNLLPGLSGGTGPAGSAAWLFLQYNKHLNVIGEEVRNSFQSDACADAKIVCDGGAISVHRLVLASASPWLKAVSFIILNVHLCFVM